MPVYITDDSHDSVVIISPDMHFVNGYSAILVQPCSFGAKSIINDINGRFSAGITNMSEDGMVLLVYEDYDIVLRACRQYEENVLFLICNIEKIIFIIIYFGCFLTMLFGVIGFIGWMLLL